MESNNNKKGSFKKVLVGALVGLIFGLFAALGFIGVNIASNLITGQEISLFAKEDSDKNAKEAKADDDEDDAADKSEDAEEAKDDKGKPDAIDKATEKIDEVEDEIYEKIAKVAPPETQDQGVYVTDVTEVVKAVMPAVVSVNNKFTERYSYFGQVYSQDNESAGSGIIVGQSDSELLIATNNHVVEDAEELMVTFSDTDTATAQIKGTDPERDLAVIAVALSDIKSSTMQDIAIASLGDSDALLVGEPVVAIGNALGYGQSVTTGVVSALNRTKEVTAYYTGTPDDGTEKYEFIQTDAAINPGNSGGALLNMRGEVIGINSSKIGGNTIEGMGYAIPISDAKPIIRDLMNKSTKTKVSENEKGYLGITGVTVEKEYAQIYGMPVGVYVSSVTEGSAADKAGLIKGDIITEIDGQEVETMEALKKELEYYSAGTTVKLTIMQGSPVGYQSKTVEVTLGKSSDS